MLPRQPFWRHLRHLQSVRVLAVHKSRIALTNEGIDRFVVIIGVMRKRLVGRGELQQQLAVMAQDVVASRLAVELVAGKGWPDTVQAAVAKTIASKAGPRIANTAHAVFGAIGISEEHDLGLYTRAIHSWRLESGGETLWSRKLGASVLSDTRPSVDWVRENLF